MQKIIFISVLTLFAFAILPHIDAQYFETEMNLNGDAYMITLSLGKSYQASLVVTTGSDLTWMNCEHCDQSYIQTADLFKKSDHSGNYAPLVLDDKLCKYKYNTPYEDPENICAYKYEYPNPKDLTYTIGVLIRETLMLGGPMGVVGSFNFVLGCSHITRINLPSNVQGIVGFGGGELSLISQLGEKISHTFSYCLVPTSTKSKLRLGYKSEKHSIDRVITSFVLRPPQSFYYIKLVTITVLQKKTFIHDDVIIDPAVAITFLHFRVYNRLKEIILEELGTEYEQADKSGVYDLCFDSEKIKDMSLPRLVLGFSGGNVVLQDGNVFVDYDGQTCLAILSAPENHNSVIGNIAQSNFQVEYDLFYKKISFAPRDCAAF